MTTIELKPKETKELAVTSTIVFQNQEANTAIKFSTDGGTNGWFEAASDQMYKIKGPIWFQNPHGRTKATLVYTEIS